MLQAKPRFVLLAAVAGLLATAQAQQKPQYDFHLQADRARELYRISAFAHGHRHGYEDGFRRADEEIHLGHPRRELKETDVPKLMGYQREFGDKRLFQQGFVYGFMAGYVDSFEDRSFRLPTWSRAVPPFPSLSRLPDGGEFPQLDKVVRTQFEQGVLQGYHKGLSSQIIDSDPRAVAQQASNTCSEDSQVKENGYCYGFTQGFLYGVSDRGSVGQTGKISIARNAETDKKPAVVHVP